MEQNPFKTIQRGEDGVYRWGYELNIVTNPVILLMFVKFIVVFCAVIFCFDVFSDWGSYNFSERLVDNARMVCLLALAMIALVWVSMIVLQAVVYGGRYRVVFEMDDEGVLHRQVNSQFLKSKKVSFAGFVMGLVAGKPGVAGANLLAATKSSSYSAFSKVKSVKPKRWLHTIKVNETLEKNQVYVPSEDFDAVYQYILERCPQAK